MAAICILASVLGSLLMLGCSKTFHAVRVIHEGEQEYVRLAKPQTPGQFVLFAHPLVLREQDWARLLDRLYVKPRKSFLFFEAAQGSASPAFNEQEKGYLAIHLAEAFQQARPDELVQFYLSCPREPGVSEVTSGGLFVESGQLHLLIANYRLAVSMPFIQRAIWDNPLRPHGEVFYDIIPQQHQTLRRDWRWHLSRPLERQVSELLIDYLASLAIEEPHSQTDDGSRFEQRLRALDRLREQGLITEEEYQSQRQRLLDTL